MDAYTPLTSSTKSTTIIVRKGYTKMNRQNKNQTSIGLAGNTFALFVILALSLSFNILNSNSASATPSSLTVSVSSGADPKVYVAPTASGNFATSTAATFSVTTTHATGYSLSASTTTMTDGTNTIPTHNISAGVSADNYADSTYASSNNLNNTWAYLPNKYDSAANTLYLPAPITTTQTIDETSSSTTGGPYTVSIGTRIDNNMPRGSYASTFTLTATTKPTPYSITYNQNTTDTVTNMPANTSTTYSNSEIVANAISSTVPARTGYTFKGWCTVQTADDATCTGTTYNPDGAGTSLDLTLDQTAASNAVTLYAVWENNNINLYNAVASMNKGKQTLQDIQQEITVPTSTDKTQDTSNSGVYEYDPSVFGMSSDASNDNKIYYYRGVLDSNLDGTYNTHGSNGDGIYYPNYVILQADDNRTTTDTCWRIVRTTGSGGVKMIYNGRWNGSTCANDTTDAQVATSSFNGDSSTNYQIVRVGYTYNNSYASNTANTATIADIFGSDSNSSVNNTRSDIKIYIEDTWYANNMTDYTDILEPSAGYCNDRTMYESNSYTLQPENTNITTYGTGNMTPHLFGALVRNNGNRTITLNCARSVVDLYRYVENSTGLGNELKYPVALLTADESSFAGAGTSSSPNSGAPVYSLDNFLGSGSWFWLLSPASRSSYAYTYSYSVLEPGALYPPIVSDIHGVRPVVSLIPGITATSGSGTAVDPWVVNAP